MSAVNFRNFLTLFENVPELDDYLRRLRDGPIRNYKAFQPRGFTTGGIWNEIVSDF